MIAASRSFHCERALVDGALLDGVRVEVADGRVARLWSGVASSEDDVRLGVVVPGFANAHSHAFHRLLRGRTHGDGGDFWRWREKMYQVAAELTPEGYRDVAVRVFTEMRDAGYTAVGEFHYVHHDPRGSAYPGHLMELALADAAATVGIRLVLLDTCYLQGGFERPLAQEQRRFGDADVHRWLERWHALRDAVVASGQGLVTVGAAVHSVRAVSRADLAVIAGGIPGDVPLHAHVSEQPAENRACVEAFGLTPVALFAEAGLLTSRFSAVHATHLTDEDVHALAEADTTVVMCPTTEADLGDGIGPARELLTAGARIAMGSDQHVVIDPWEELSRLELDQRLRLQRRGVFEVEELWTAGTRAGYRSLGLAEGDGAGLRPGDLFDVVEVDPASPRTWGADPPQLPLVARSADVTATVVGGRLTRAAASTSRPTRSGAGAAVATTRPPDGARERG